MIVYFDLIQIVYIDFLSYMCSQFQRSDKDVFKSYHYDTTYSLRVINIVTS